MLVFWVLTSCGLVGTNVLEEYCHHLKARRWRHCVSPKRWYLSASSHGVTSQMTNIDIWPGDRLS
jgi:hypothetical protein